MKRETYTRDNWSRDLCALILCVLLIISLSVVNARGELSSQTAFSTDHIIGGESVDLTDTSIALIVNQETFCTGTLVAPQLVLTAAHCLYTPSLLSLKEFYVYIGGKFYNVAKGYHHSLFDNSMPPSTALPVDIGMLVLEEPVENVEPMPILYDWAVTKGQKFVVYGYGANESGFEEVSTLDDLKKIGRGAVMKVSNIGAGYFASNHALSGASTCSGDSGGLAAFIYGDYIAAVGVVSSGTNKYTADGVCLLSSGGYSMFVDLLSPSSQSFLSAFSGLSYLSGRLAVIHTNSITLVQLLEELLKVKNLKFVKKNLSFVLGAIQPMRDVSSGARRFHLMKAYKFCKQAKRKKKRKAVRRRIKKAIKQMKFVVDMGVS